MTSNRYEYSSAVSILRQPVPVNDILSIDTRSLMVKYVARIGEWMGCAAQVGVLGSSLAQKLVYLA
jgi:hypothetical protein